jgi:hypothetical protein
MMWKYLKRGKTYCILSLRYEVPQIMTGIIHTHFPIELIGNIMYCKLSCRLISNYPCCKYSIRIEKWVILLIKGRRILQYSTHTLGNIATCDGGRGIALQGRKLGWGRVGGRGWRSHLCRLYQWTTFLTIKYNRIKKKNIQRPCLVFSLECSTYSKLTTHWASHLRGFWVSRLEGRDQAEGGRGGGGTGILT